MSTIPGEKVECPQHGTSAPTFACVHIAEGSQLGVHFPEGSLEPWPDALCTACATEPKWTDEVALQRIRVLCSTCWEDAFARNTRVPPVADVDGFLNEARERAHVRQTRWIEEYGVNAHRHYHYGLDDAQPWLGFGASEKSYSVMCEALVIGSWSARSKTWLWGWANDWWAARLTTPIVAVKRHGEQHGVEPLWRSQSDADEDRAFALAASVLEIMPEIDGIYRSPNEGGSLFLAACKTKRLS